MSTLVYVINQNGHALMPCHPSKARKLLRDRRAKVVGRSPFTIKLLWDCEEQVQEVTLGIDKGSHVTGFSCIGKGQILLSGEIHHRLDVKDKMTARRTNRRNRRSQTATLRKARNLPKAHDADALCLATYGSGELVPYDRGHFYTVSFRPRRTRRQYHDLPRKGQGRVKYQVNEELEGFRKGDVVRVKGKYLKQINSICTFPRT